MKKSGYMVQAVLMLLATVALTTAQAGMQNACGSSGQTMKNACGSSGNMMKNARSSPKRPPKNACGSSMQ